MAAGPGGVGHWWRSDVGVLIEFRRASHDDNFGHRRRTSGPRHRGRFRLPAGGDFFDPHPHIRRRDGGHAIRGPIRPQCGGWRAERVGTRRRSGIRRTARRCWSATNTAWCAASTSRRSAPRKGTRSSGSPSACSSSARSSAASCRSRMASSLSHVTFMALPSPERPAFAPASVALASRRAQVGTAQPAARMARRAHVRRIGRLAIRAGGTRMYCAIGGRLG